ncbi:hypothetical protein DM01DRAFT_1382712 [Hesseltinella vesiculosa]|uniref:Uncharacterized protein n=1 Tax=Hesseltinella vesiculosa TaxID=101127 RepID=A0A1X2GJU3_9FUNG|nr:hypothetical protein DM01DRAFT_1382712 [Hesseltinella vesiculosa]
MSSPQRLRQHLKIHDILTPQRPLGFRRKRRSSTRAEDHSLELELLDPNALLFPPVDHDDHFVAQQFNVTNAIYEFQCSILQQKWKLSIEDHIHHALAINSILLLSQNKYPENLSPYFCEASLKATISKIKSIYGLNLPSVQTKTVSDIFSILQELDVGTVSRRQAIVKLLQLDLSPDERKFANGLTDLVKKLPRVPIEEDVNEYELSTRFADPFLCGLFDDPEEGVYLRWTNDISFEARKNDTLWTCRPDLTITSLKGVKWTTSHGYGEAKSACHEANNFVLSKDLIRVAMFCKNALDEQNLDGILGLQIIGRRITFYLLVLPSQGLYVMYELGTLELPNSLCGLRKLLMDMPLGLLVLDVFRRLCIRSDSPFQPSRHRPTVSMSSFDGIFSASQDRKRPCHLKKYG